MSQMCAVTGCKLHFNLDADSRMDNVLGHYLDEHPDHYRLRDVINTYEYPNQCRDCGDRFWTALELSDREIWVEANCPDCAEEDEMLKMYVRKLKPKEVVKYAEPCIEEGEE